MATIRLQCPSCDARFKSAATAGKVKCPECDKAVRVPDPDDEDDSDEHEEEAAPKRRGVSKAKPATVAGLKSRRGRDEDEEEDRPRHRTRGVRKKEKAGSPALLFLGLGGGGLLLLVVAVVAVILLLRKGDGGRRADNGPPPFQPGGVMPGPQGGFPDPNAGKQQQPPVDVKTATPVATLTAKQMYEENKRDPNFMMTKYGGKVVEVSGIVKDADDDILILETGTQFEYVSCRADLGTWTKQALAGKRIRLKGRVPTSQLDPVPFKWVIISVGN